MFDRAGTTTAISAVGPAVVTQPGAPRPARTATWPASCSRQPLSPSCRTRAGSCSGTRSRPDPPPATLRQGSPPPHRRRLLRAAASWTSRRATTRRRQTTRTWRSSCPVGSSSDGRAPGGRWQRGRSPCASGCRSRRRRRPTPSRMACPRKGRREARGRYIKEDSELGTFGIF